MNDTELRESRARIVSSTLATRQRIERTLHDGPQQHLVSIAVKLRLAESALGDDAGEARSQLEEVRREVQDTIEHLRELAHEIYPPLLADRGLGQALRAAAGRAEVDVELNVAGDDARRYPPETEAAVYFCVLDAIEAATGPISVSVAEEDAHLLLDVSGPLTDGPALLDMTDRTDTLGGELSFEPWGDGLYVRASIPLPA